MINININRDLKLINPALQGNTFSLHPVVSDKVNKSPSFTIRERSCAILCDSEILKNRNDT